MKKYRVECNYGSRYFADAAQAFTFYKRKKARNLDVEIWLVTYCYDRSAGRFSAAQELLDYSLTKMPKC